MTMTSMTADVYALPDLDPYEISDLILEDERWKVAEEFGLKSVDVQVDPTDPSNGRIRTKWADPGGAHEFLLKFVRPFHFFEKDKKLIEPVSKPSITVSAYRMDKAINLKRSCK